MNHIDLAPNYAGTLMGITNGASNVISIIAPLVVGIVVKEEVHNFKFNKKNKLIFLTNIFRQIRVNGKSFSLYLLQFIL